MQDLRQLTRTRRWRYKTLHRPVHAYKAVRDWLGINLVVIVYTALLVSKKHLQQRIHLTKLVCQSIYGLILIMTSFCTYPGQLFNSFNKQVYYFNCKLTAIDEYKKFCAIIALESNSTK
jgi:hypothetical protein